MTGDNPIQSNFPAAITSHPPMSVTLHASNPRRYTCGFFTPPWSGFPPSRRHLKAHLTLLCMSNGSLDSC